MDTDLNLDYLDEPIVPTDVDEDERYLLDEQETEDETKRKAEEAEEARLQALVDRKLADRFTQTPQTPLRTPPPEAPKSEYSLGLSEAELIEKMADEITGDLAMDPKAAIKKVLTATRAMTKQSTESNNARVNRAEIAQWRASKRDDPMFKAIQEDVDSEIATYTEAQLAAATPASLRRALELAEDSALGRYYKKQLQDRNTKRAVEPPRYSGGRSGGGSVAAPVRMTQADKDLIRMAKSAGLGDKEIRELVKENRR